MATFNSTIKSVLLVCKLGDRRNKERFLTVRGEARRRNKLYTLSSILWVCSVVYPRPQSTVERSKLFVSRTVQLSYKQWMTVFWDRLKVSVYSFRSRLTSQWMYQAIYVTMDSDIIINHNGSPRRYLEALVQLFHLTRSLHLCSFLAGSYYISWNFHNVVLFCVVQGMICCSGHWYCPDYA